MAYFSNSEEALFYEDQYCDHCRHRGPVDGPGCPIMLLHMLWNYDAVGKNADETKRAALEILIPRSKDGLSNEQCKMFVLK